MLYSHAVHLDQRERSDFLVYIIETYLEIRNHKRRDIGNHIQCAAWVTAVSKRSHASIVSDKQTLSRVNKYFPASQIIPLE